MSEIFKGSPALAGSIALAVLLFAFLLTRLFTSSSSSSKPKKHENSCLLVGPSGGGKTALFSKLVHGDAGESLTSLKENVGVIPPESLESSKPITLIDLPGHPRLRTNYLSQFLPDSKGCIFVIDGSAGLGGKALRDTAEHVHILISLLRNLPPSSSPPPKVLFYLSKSDLLTSASSLQLFISRLRSALERELDRRRSAASGQVGSAGVGTGGVGSKLEGLEEVTNVRNLTLWERVFGRKKIDVGGGRSLPNDEGEILAMEDLDIEGEGFSWDKLELDIKWTGGSVIKGTEGGMGEVKQWLENLVQ